MRNKHKQPPVLPRRAASQSRNNAPVFSYYNNRSAIEANTGRGQLRGGDVQSRRFAWGNIPAVIASFVIAGCVLYAGTLSTTPKVVTVDDTRDGVARSTDTYQQYAQGLFGSSVWHYLKATIDTRDISERMRAQFPELGQASVTVPLINRTPIVTIKTVRPAYILTSGANAYYLGANGKALAAVTGSTSVPDGILTIQDQSGVVVDVGKQALTRNDITFINQVVFQLQSKQKSIEQLTLPPIPYELHVKPKDAPYYIKYNMLGDAREQAGTFLAVEAKLAGDKVVPKEYIDVRVEERAFYR